MKTLLCFDAHELANNTSSNSYTILTTQILFHYLGTTALTAKVKVNARWQIKLTSGYGVKAIRKWNLLALQ